MAKSESISKLYRMLKQARRPVSMEELTARLERSKASIERYLQELRDTHMLDIVYEKEANGYRLQYDEKNGLELPSHLFTTQEINALLLIEQIIHDLEPGFLREDTEQLKQHLANIGQKLTGSMQRELNRIRMINIGRREGNIRYLTPITQAVLGNKRIEFRYASRSTRNDQSRRIVSPQRLTHYRDNWYLDAWCHKREGLRTFALDRIDKLQPLHQQAIRISAKKLDHYYAGTFGIFGGKKTSDAVLKFSPHRAKWVAAETWHPKQKGEWLEDGSYLLTIPYGNDTELIGDILKYGDEVEVLAPHVLREKINEKIAKLRAVYQK